MDRGRLEAFSDGVFAVAITLLVLNLTVAGPGPGHPHLFTQLSDHWPAFAGYLISFLVIGIIWVNHHVLVRQITTVDRTLLFVNLMLLLFVVLIPFGTATMADYLPHNSWDARLAMVLYGGTLLGMSAGFGAIFEWTLHGQGRVQQPLPPEQHWPARWRFVGGALVYVVAIVVALVNALAAFLLIGLVAVYYVFERTPNSSAGGDDDDEPVV